MTGFRPKLLDCLRGYDKAAFWSDLGAGVTVGLIALPLAIGFAIASGVNPTQGLWTAIIAGFLIAAFGGSRVQIGGPTGAFVPILAGIVALHGYDGLAVATLMAGVILVVMGGLKLGNLIKFIPFPVIAGFTAGIAVIIFVGQLKDFFGLDFAMPRHTPNQVAAVISHLGQTHWHTAGMGGLSLAILLAWPKSWRRFPASIPAIIIPAILVAVLHWDVHTIQSRFGGIPGGFPSLSFPNVTFDQIQSLMIPALTIAMLGSIESLLSAIVADGMIESRHDSNQELIGQGLANIASPFFGGISATGAIARTAANIRSGGRTPIAGILHAVTLLVIVLVAAPLAKYIPLTALAAVLFVVAYRMGEWDNFRDLRRGPKGDFAVLLITFALTVIFDLTVAVGVGLAISIVLFVRRMEEITQIRMIDSTSDMETGGDSIRGKQVPDGVVVFRIAGPFFFGAAEKLEAALARAGALPKVVIFRMRKVPAIDATGLRAMEIALEKFHHKKTVLVLSGVQPQPMKVFYEAGFADKIGLDNICANLDAALERARKLLGDPPSSS